MKISIITVVFNGVQTIKDTIESVLNQDNQKIEYIIVDGGSTDGTLGIIEKYKDKISNYISQPDKGIYNAMNKGLKLASGEIIAFLNSDDIYADNSVLSEIAAVIREKNLDALFGDIIYFDKNRRERIVRYWKTGEYKKGAFFYGWVPPHPSFFCKREIFEKYGCFRDDFKIAGDFELMLRFIEKNKIKTGYLPKVIAKMRSGGKANVLKGFIKGNSEIIKSFRLNGLKISPLFFVHKPIKKIFQLFGKPQC